MHFVMLYFYICLSRTLSHVQLYAAHTDLPHCYLAGAPVTKHAVPSHVITILTVPILGGTLALTV